MHSSINRLPALNVHLINKTNGYSGYGISSSVNGGMKNECLQEQKIDNLGKAFNF